MSERTPMQLRRTESRPLSDEARRLYEQGVDRFGAGRFADALDVLTSAARLAPDYARIRSMRGLCLAYVERDFEQARTLCESAAKQEFFNPDLYLNLARVYLVFGRRAEALRYLRRGLMIDPGHIRIQDEMARLGRRGRPILPFLPRRHPLNRALGGARNLIRSRFSRSAAA